jgi:hypothetical protein
MTAQSDITSRVIVPGTLFAHYREGRIESWTFSPAVSDAGYFGPPARVFDDIDADGDQVRAGDGRLDQRPDLDVENTGGPFWLAVEDALSAGTVFAQLTVEWTE